MCGKERYLICKRKCLGYAKLKSTQTEELVVRSVIKIFPLKKNKNQFIGITATFKKETRKCIEEINAEWSNDLQCYFLKLNQKNKRKVLWHFRNNNYYVDYSAFTLNKKRLNKNITRVLTKEKINILSQFHHYLYGKRFSKSTIKTYTSFVRKLLFFIDKRVGELHHRDVEQFVEDEIAAKKYAISSHRQCISALKHFFEFCELPAIHLEKLYRPRKDRKLPQVLSREEVVELLRATRNLKHRALLALIYSAGLRVGEVLNLRLYDVDVDRKQIIIKQGKGRKDRVVVLAETFLPLLFNYLRTYCPVEYFIEGQQGGAYSSSSVRNILKQSCRRAGLRKRITPHTLRHSYATHLLENGVDLRYIQELLGHAKPETTMIYTHVAKKDLLSIRSPLDVTLQNMAGKDKVIPGNISQNLLGNKEF